MDPSLGIAWGKGSLTIAADQLQAINPWTVMIFAPLFSKLFQKIDPDMRVLTVGNKILAGFLLQAVASGLMSAAGFLAESSNEKLSILWPATAYFILTIAEILVYGTGLELAYSAAPSNLKGFVTACFLTTSACGNLINIWFSGLYGTILSPGSFFGISALMVAAAACVFFRLSRKLGIKSNIVP